MQDDSAAVSHLLKIVQRQYTQQITDTKLASTLYQGDQGDERKKIIRPKGLKRFIMENCSENLLWLVDAGISKCAFIQFRTKSEELKIPREIEFSWYRSNSKPQYLEPWILKTELPDTTPGSDHSILRLRCAHCNLQILKGKEVHKFQSGSIWTIGIPSTLIQDPEKVWNDIKKSYTWAMTCAVCAQRIGSLYVEEFKDCPEELTFPTCKLTFRTGTKTKPQQKLIFSAKSKKQLENHLGKITKSGPSHRTRVNRMTYDYSEKVKQALEEKHKIIEEKQALEEKHKISEKGVDKAQKKLARSIRKAYEDLSVKFFAQDKYADDLKAILTPLAAYFSSQDSPKQDFVCPDWESLKKLAENTQGKFHSQLGRIVTQCRGEYKIGPFKEEDDCRRKVMKDYKGNFNQLLDVVRSTAVFSGCLDLRMFLLQLWKSKSVKIVRVKDRFFNPVATGYRDVLINIQCGQFVGELQLTVDVFWELKEISHSPLEFQRLGYKQHD